MDPRALASAEGAAGGITVETLQRFSPVAAVEEAGTGTISLSMLVARAGQDNPALNAQLDDFVRAALAANMPLNMLNHPAGHHGFDTLNDDARTHEILRHTLAFMREHLEE
jgi:dienelactone hydrolase